jgi:hypothetical protein
LVLLEKVQTMSYGFLCLLVFYSQVVRSPPRRDVLPPGFEEGSYMSPVTFKHGDLYVKGWVLDWWLHDFLSRTVDDLVEFLTRITVVRYRCLVLLMLDLFGMFRSFIV